MTGFKVRTAAAPDVAAIVRLSEQLGYRVAGPEVTAALAHIATSSDHCAFVAEDAGRVIGWIHACRRVLLESPPFGEIGGFIVDSDHRRRGAGRALLAAAEAWANSHSLSSLHVRVNTIREDEFRFYEAAGFQIQKTQRVYAKDLT